MQITKSNWTTAQCKTFYFTCNCYHVEINDGDKILFERNAQSPDWMNEKHRAITDALEALETAIFAAARQ